VTTEILSSTTPPAPAASVGTPPAGAPAAPPPLWRAGERVEAVVVGAGEGGAMLRVGKEVLVASSPVPLAPGDRLTLEVETPGASPVLRLLSQTEEPARIIARALRAALDRPGSLAALVTHLTAGAGPAVTGAARQMMERLLAALPGPAQVQTAQGLRDALAHSGLFLEARLAATAAGAVPEADLKLRLLRLRGALDPAQHRPETGVPGTQAGAALRGRVEDVLARLEADQARSLPQPDSGVTRWLLELPVRREGGADGWRIEIRQESHGPVAPTPRTWSVDLEVDLENLGRLHARVWLQGRRVWASLWAEREAPAVAAQLPWLRDCLARAGLEPGELHCWPGRPPAPAADPRPPLFSARA
jgi:hypothetical protein